ncbi:polygalacturonase non-catalytic subunit AroGP2-like [Macadamia integrifolia]|uniref:polygalacturonase non-catalytic subunit AroGP2-like n=1 Tax=Macadamia integrifolia TaxID=60698 RepID=UPI001C52C610|nr:polygalacturonase non-catalytic subunit AroGP2-like [Macadamia integrifolia]
MRHPNLMLGILIVAHLSGFLAENTFSQYWEEHIDLPYPPYWFVAKISPLTPHQVNVFLKLMEENEFASHLPSFCKLANVACSTNALATLPQKVHWTDGIIKYELAIPSGTPLWVANQGRLPYFRESMVKEGGFMEIPDLRDPMSYKSFLPRSLASKIPFSSTRIKELKKLFGVVDESNMDEYIQDTLKICEKIPISGEQCTCATSAEDLVDFVVEKLGHHVRIWNTESAEGSNENVRIRVVKLIYGNLSEPPTFCHSQPFPFQVYYCHTLQKVKVYAVEIQAQKKLNHVIMACHYDTSTWNPNHIAFKLLGFGPGLIEVCHWISQNGMVWTKNLG